MKKTLLLILVCGSWMAGCASLEDYRYRSANRGRAIIAWRHARECLPANCITRDYANGFKDGYYAVATGGSACPPVVPPPSYFAARYQSTEGQYKVSQWYLGYQAGAIASDRDGRSLWTTVPTQDGPGLQAAPTELTTDRYWSSVIDNPTISEAP